MSTIFQGSVDGNGPVASMGSSGASFDEIIDLREELERPSAGPSDWVDEPSRPERRRSLSSVRRSDVLALAGGAASSLALTTLLFAQIAPLSGALGFLFVWYVLFLAVYAALVWQDESGPAVRDRIAGVLVHSLAFVMFSALVCVVVYTLWEGREALSQLNFFTQDMSQAGPLDPLSSGGIAHALVGTLEMIAIALAITVPLGLTCAVFLNAVPGKLSRFVRTVAEAMTALPSIVAGLFIYASVILVLGVDKSGFAAALALSVMMLPIIIRAADVVLRLVPGTLKEASLALGSSQWRTMWSVVLPTAKSGLATSVILGTARGVGETSPVLLTAGFTAAMNTNPLSGPQISLPLATFNFVKSPEPNFIARGFGAAAVLMIVVLVLFVIARIIGGRGPGQLTARQQRRRVAQSAQEAARFDARDAARAASTQVPVQPTTQGELL
jgi:phosphate transport system permease protein